MANITVKQVNPQEAVCDTLRSECKTFFETVKRRAYELFDRGEKEPGREVENWLQAERELLAPIQTSVKTEDEKETLTLAVPGFSRNDIEVYVIENTLIVKALAGEQTNTPSATSQISRTLLYQYPLRQEANIAEMAASLDDGALSITIPLSKTENPVAESHVAVAA